MGHLQRFLIFFAGCALTAALLAPGLYTVVNMAAAHFHWPWLEYLAAHPLHRYFNRLVQGGILIGIWPLLKSSGFFSLTALALRSPCPLRLWLTGTALSFLLLGAYFLTLMALGWQEWIGFAPGRNWTTIAIKIGATAVVVSLLEEVFFRGYFYQLCVRQVGRRSALAWNMIFFASLHYLKPAQADHLRQVDWTSGFQILGLAFHRFAAPSELVGGFAVLMFIAWMLCWSLDRTANLYLAIGLHAGWILVLQGAAEISRPSSPLPGWLLGGGDLSQGILACVPLLLQFLVLRWWLNHEQAKSGPTHSATRNPTVRRT